MANTLRDNQIEQLRPRSDIATTETEAGPSFLRTVGPGDAQEFLDLTAALSPEDQRRVEEVDIYSVPGGGVELFKGTGLPGPQVPLQNLQSYIHTGPTGTEPVPERLQDLSEAELAKIQTGEAVDPRLQALIDQPDIAQIEQDLALVRNVDPTKLKGEDLENYNAAQERIDIFAAPPKPTGQLPQVATRAQLDQFKQHLIQTQFGGVDPRRRNIAEEIMQLPDMFFQRYYEKMWQEPAMAAGQIMPRWVDLDLSKKKAVMNEAKVLEEKRRREEQKIQVQAYHGAINAAEDQIERTEQAIQQITERNLKMRAFEEKGRARAAEDLPKVSKQILDAQLQVNAIRDQYGENSPQMMAHRQYITDLVKQQSTLRRAATETRTADEPVRGGEPEPGAAPGEMTLEQMVQEAKRRHPNDREAAKALLAEWGVSTQSTGKKQKKQREKTRTPSGLLVEQSPTWHTRLGNKGA